MDVRFGSLGAELGFGVGVCVSALITLLVAVSVPLTLYVLLLAWFSFMAVFNKKRHKEAIKILELLVRARMRGH